MTKPIILFILKALEGRGAERMVTTLARAYVQMEYQVHMLCLESTRQMPLDAQVQYHLVPYDQVFLEQQLTINSEQALSYKAVAQRIDAYVLKHIGTPNLILVNIYKLNWIMSYSQLPNLINVLHTALSQQLKNELKANSQLTKDHLKRVYGRHPCSAVSAGAQQDLLTLIGDTNTTTTITIYNPCDIDDITQSAAQPPNISQFGLIADGYIIHVASFDTMKNHRHLLQAYAKSERKLPLVLVGKGKLEDEIKALAFDLGIETHVKFLGFQANPYPLIAGAALLVLTSKFEGFGYVIVEAQALGVPAISTDCPFGPRELLPTHNLVAVDDIDALAALIDSAVCQPSHYLTAFDSKLLPANIANEYLKFAQLMSIKTIK